MLTVVVDEIDVLNCLWCRCSRHEAENPENDASVTRDDWPAQNIQSPASNGKFNSNNRHQVSSCKILQGVILKAPIAVY